MVHSSEIDAPLGGLEMAGIDIDAAGGLGAAVAAMDKETAARQYLAADAGGGMMGIEGAAEAAPPQEDLKILGVEAVPLTATTMVKFRQYEKKVPVYGSFVGVELDDANTLISMNKSVTDPIDIDPVAKIAPAVAIERVVTEVGKTDDVLAATPRLFYYFDEQAGRWRLTYILEDVRGPREETYESVSAVPQFFDFVVDAHTAELVAQLPRTHLIDEFDSARDVLNQSRRFRFGTANGGTRIMRDPTQNVHTHDFGFLDLDSRTGSLPGNYVSNPPAWAAAGVSAHANAVDVASFISTVLRRNGLDNLGGRIVSSINCLEFANPSREWRSAAWLGGFKQMVYGQRVVAGGGLRSYAAASDVVAHELFHGLTDYTARLEYHGETGALNESFSDIFGIIVSNQGRPISGWNWEMGEALTGTGVPLRDLRDPTLKGQPAHMDDFRVLPDTRAGDWGGVHVNSGIHNKAAFNLITSKDAGGADLFTPADVAALFYLALSQRLSRTSRFIHSRQGVEVSARSYFRTDPRVTEKVRAISNAFDAVGIR